MPSPDETDTLVVTVQRATLILRPGVVPSGASALAQVQAHEARTDDPHAAAGYVTLAEVQAAVPASTLDSGEVAGLDGIGLGIDNRALTEADIGVMVQAADDDLAAIAALSGGGFPAQTAAHTWVLRGFSAGGAGLSVTNPLGQAAGVVYSLADDVAAIEALGSTGLAARTGASTWAVRTIQGPVAGIVVTNGDGVAGPPALTLANDLLAVEALGGTGLAVRTGTDTWSVRTLTGPVQGLTITNGDGVSGAPTITLANDLLGLEALGSTGIPVRTGTDTWAQRSIAVGAAGLSVSNAAGVAGNPTIDLADDLAAVEGLGSTGLAARTGTSTWSVRTLTGPAAGISVSNGDGVSGNPTLALANDLAALEALSSTGLAARTATDTWAQRTITGTAPVSVSNGDGVSGNPTLSLVQTDDTKFDQHLVLASPVTDSTGSNVDVTGMSFQPSANATYLVQVWGHYSTAALTTGLRWQISCGANITGTSYAIAPASASSQVFRLGPINTNVVGSGSATTAKEPIAGWALIVAASSPGVVKLQIATEVAASQVSLDAAVMRYRRVA